MVISLVWQAETWLMLGRVLRSLQVSPRSCRTYRAWSCYWGGTKKNSGARLSEAEGKQKKKKETLFAVLLWPRECVRSLVCAWRPPPAWTRRRKSWGSSDEGRRSWPAPPRSRSRSTSPSLHRHIFRSCGRCERWGSLRRKKGNKFSFFFFFFPLTQNWDLSRGSQRSHLTFAAGWSEVVHQEAKEVVELQKKREKTIILKEKNPILLFFLNKKKLILCLMMWMNPRH